MKTRRFLGTLLATVLAATSLSLVTSASPASAATATKIVGGTSGKKWIYPGYPSNQQPGAIVFGTKLQLSINVKAANGDQVYDGSLKVQRKQPGKGWKTIKKSSSAYLYSSTKAVSNAKYRVLYSGTSTYAPSGAGVKAKVQRKLTYKNVGTRKVILKGNVAPKVRGKVAIMKKRGKKFVKFRVVRTNKQGVFRVGLPAPRKGRFYWRIEMGANKWFAKTQTGQFYTYSYRSAARTTS